MRRGWKILGSALLAPLAACTAAGPIGRDAVEYNRELSNANNEMLLLNVARASRQHPLFITSVTEVSRSISTKGSLSGVFPVGGNQNPKLRTFTPGLEASGGPTAKVAVWDNEKFMRGFTAPISMETFRYLWGQGWPRELLLLVLVRRITFRTEECTLDLVGYPKSPAEYDVYHDAVMTLAKADAIVPKEGPEKDAYTAKVKVTKRHPLLLKDLAAAAAAGLELGGTDTEIQVKPKKKLLGYAFVSTKSCKALDDADAAAREASRTGAVAPPTPAPAATRRGRALEALAKAIQSGAPVRAGAGTSDAEPVAPEDRPEIKLYLRSPEAILYHLGELARAELDSPGHANVVRFRSANRLGRPLFNVCAREGGCQECPLSTEYCGETFTLNGNTEADESMHVLSLLSILISLQKSADEIPKGGVVTLVGN